MDAATLALFGAMGAATYGMRVIALLVPLPGEILRRAEPYLGLVAPAVLSALAAVATLVATADGEASLELDVDLVPILLGLATVALRGNLAVGIAIGVAAAAALHWLVG